MPHPDPRTAPHTETLQMTTGHLLGTFGVPLASVTFYPAYGVSLGGSDMWEEGVKTVRYLPKRLTT